MNTKQKKALYESIMKSVSKTVKKQLNESGEVELGFDENSEIYITVYFSSNDPENCYSNNTANINHPSAVNIIKNLMQDYIYTTDETNTLLNDMFRNLGEVLHIPEYYMDGMHSSFLFHL